MSKRDFFGDKFFVLGHRGFSDRYPENTMMSFEACMEVPGVDGFELDVRICKSGEVVISHDSCIKRTAGLDKKVEELTYDELQQIDVGSFKDPKFSAARIPLLEDVFKRFGDSIYYDIELKVDPWKFNVELCRKTLALIRKYHLEKKVMVSSFGPFALRYFGNLCGHQIETADIYEDTPEVPKFIGRGGGRWISLSTFAKPCRKQLNVAHSIMIDNRPMITWTVNNEETAQFFMDLKKKGCNIRGLIGNDPEILAKVVAKNNFLKK